MRGPGGRRGRVAGAGSGPRGHLARVAKVVAEADLALLADAAQVLPVRIAGAGSPSAAMPRCVRHQAVYGLPRILNLVLEPF